MKTRIFFIITLLLFALCNVDAQSTQCKGTTQAGARCKNKTTNPNGYCHMHQGQVPNNNTSDTTKNKITNVVSSTKENNSQNITTPATENKRRTVSVQCSAMTKAGARCKRMTYSPNGKCSVHGGD